MLLSVVKSMSYRELQSHLKAHRELGHDVTVKLNAKREVLEAELTRVSDAEWQAQQDYVLEVMELPTVEQLMSQADEIHTQCDLPSDYYCHGQSCLLPVRATATVKRQAIKPQALAIAKQVQSVAHPKPITKPEPIACKPSKRQSFEWWQQEQNAKKEQAKRDAQVKLAKHEAECAKRREEAQAKFQQYVEERRYQAQLRHEQRQAKLLQEQVQRQQRNAAMKLRLANPAAREAAYYGGYKAA